jgi:hypothetical protein
MTYDEFRLCKGCPVKGARYFDPDGYWCCAHPEAYKHRSDATPESIAKEEQSRKEYPISEKDEYSVPFVCMKTCPANHWKRTIEGGQIPKGQSELVTDAEYALAGERAIR